MADARLQTILTYNEHPWHQQIELGDGQMTPGMWPQPHIREALAGLSLGGKRVLEIGALEGRWAYFMERAGASRVYATDIYWNGDGPFQKKFWLLHEYFGSSVVYQRRSICEMVPADFEELFDVVNFTGVYYHLQDPLRGLRHVCRLLAPGGVALIEGAVLAEPGCFARFWHREVLEGDLSNWWTPTENCLEDWMAAGGLSYDRLPGVVASPYRTNAGEVMVARAVYLARRFN